MNIIAKRLKKAFQDYDFSDRFKYSGAFFEKYFTSDGKIHIDLLSGNIDTKEVTPWQAKLIDENKWKIFNVISGRSIEVEANDDKEIAKAILEFARMH